MSQDAPAVPTATPPQDEAVEPTLPARPAEPSLPARLGAEAFGTFLLVFVGLGIGLYASLVGTGTVGVALGFGVALAAGIATVGHVSGGHFNPAVTLGSALAGRTPWKDVVPYWVAQVVAGTAAAGVLFVTIPRSMFSGDSSLASSAREVFSGVANGFGEHSAAYAGGLRNFYEQTLAQYPGVTVAQITEAVDAGQLTGPSLTQFDLPAALIIEAVVTALFVGVVLAVTGKRKMRLAPLVIGLSFTVLLLLAGPITNGSINPARSFAAAVFSDGWALGQVWLFWVAPLVGAAFAGLVVRLISLPPVPAVSYEEVEYDAELSGADTDAASASEEFLTEEILAEAIAQEATEAEAAADELALAEEQAEEELAESIADDDAPVVTDEAAVVVQDEDPDEAAKDEAAEDVEIAAVEDEVEDETDDERR